MAGDPRDVLEVLRYELSYLEQGGYRRNGDGALNSPFQASYSCLNFGNPLRPHACRECLLSEFVPEWARTEDVPCHYIQLNGGETVATLMASGDRTRLVLGLEQWLRATIARLSALRERDAKSA